MPDNTQSDTIPEFITNERAEGVFTQLEGYSVRLERDPTIMGPSYVHSKLKECRDFSIEVESLLVEFYDVERKVKNMLAALKEAYKAEKAELMVLDDEVKKGRSAADREAIADFKLKQNTANINDLSEQLVNVRYVLRAVELKREGLNRTNNDVKKQVALMEFAKSNATPIETESDYDDLPLEDGTGTQLDDDEDVSGLFTDEIEKIDEPEAIEELPSEPPPEVISESVEQHMATEEDGDPLADSAISDLEDIDGFLSEINVDEEPVIEKEPEEDEEVDIEALLNSAPVDEAEDVEEKTPDNGAAMTPENGKSEIAASKSEETSKKVATHVDEEVVDIGAFLDS